MSAGRGPWRVMAVSLAVVTLGLAGVCVFPPTKSDETWLRFVGFLIATLGGIVALVVSAVWCLVAAIRARGRK